MYPHYALRERQGKGENALRNLRISVAVTLKRKLPVWDSKTVLLYSPINFFSRVKFFCHHSVLLPI
jgi:hypothetical protein